jgi:hypothetical protein
METATKYQFYSFQAIPQPNFDEAMEQLAAMFEETLKTNLAKKYPYAKGYFGQKPQTGIRDMKKKTGNLYNSIKVSFDPTINRLKIMMLDYWKNVNDGRQPGTYPPPNAIEKWIKIKGLNRDPKGRFKKFKIKSVAFAISRSIKENGIEPTNFYDDSFDLFIKEFNKPNGPASKLGMDLKQFINKNLQQPT